MAGTLEGQDKGKMNDFVVIDGVHVAWVTPPSTLEAMKTFEVREDDIFIVTYPKSGTCVSRVNRFLNGRVGARGTCNVDGLMPGGSCNRFGHRTLQI